MKGILAFLLTLLFGFSGMGAEAPAAAENEFIVLVELDTADRVCELSCDYMLDGEWTGRRTVCCADGKSPLPGRVYESFLPEDFPEDADVSGLSLAFFLSDSFSDGDDGAPAAREGGTPVKNEIAIPAQYGKTYAVVITGDSENGYRAAVEE